MIGFGNPVVAGTILVRSAVQSPNYVAGSSGWTINQDGTVEFNNATIRGTLSADNGNILLNSAGLHIEGNGNQYDINKTAGFLARLLPDTSQETQITAGGVFLTPPDPSPAGNNVDFASWFVGYANSGLANETPYSQFSGVAITGKSAPSLTFFGQSANSSVDDSRIICNGHLEDLNLTGIASTNANFGPIGAISVFLQTANIDWLANSAYFVRVQGRWQPSNTTTPRIVWTVRKTNAAGAVIVNIGRQTAISVEPYNVCTTGIFTVGASTVTATPIVLTIQSGSAAGVNDVTALAPFTMEVFWMGSSGNYSDNPVLT